MPYWVSSLSLHHMKRVSFAAVCSLLIFAVAAFTSCANMVPPTGGPRDSTAPVLMRVIPADSSVTVPVVQQKPVVLTFDEYVTLDNVQENLIVSPILKNQPNVTSRLQNVFIRLRDTLEPNTTYSFNFGKAIRDVNEGNAIAYTYVFSTGKTIDANGLRGKVILAETGKVDSTLIVVLHRNLADSAVKKQDPRYYAKVDGKGNFRFQFLPATPFRIYAIPGGFFKRYKDSTELFAFADSLVVPGDTASLPQINLYAYREATDSAGSKGPATANKPGNKKEERQKITDSVVKYAAPNALGLDVLGTFVITFKNPVQLIDTAAFRLTDTLHKPVGMPHYLLDSMRKQLTVLYPWKTDTYYHLLLPKEAVTDSAGHTLARNDTIRLQTKRDADYGSIQLRFKNVDASRNPVLQLMQNEKIVESIDMKQAVWTRKLYPPGTYQLRVLYDRNRNGRWDAGSFALKRQPEIVVALSQDLSIRANWDNESEVRL
jgi:hypothetical protein